MTSKKLSFCSVISLPEYYLRIFAIVPPSRHGNTANISIFCGCALITGSLITAGFFTAGTFWKFLNPSGPTDHTLHVKNPIISCLTNVPFAAQNWRGLLILCALLRKRSVWQTIQSQADDLFAATASGSEKAVKLLRTWSLAAKGLFAIVLVSCAVIHGLSWASIKVQDPTFYSLTNMSLEGWAPLPIKIYPLAVLGLWITFVTVPVLLSQLAYTAVILHAFLLRYCVRKFHHSISMETERLRTVTFATIDSKKQAIELDLFGKKLEQFRKQYILMAAFCGSLNNYYGNLLSFAYGLDMLCAAGYVAAIVSDSIPVPLHWAMNYGNFALISGVWVIGLLTPLTKVYEEDRNMVLSLYHLSETATSRLINAEIHTVCQLDTVQLSLHLHSFVTMISSNNMIQIQGTEIMPIRRSLLAATCAFLVSAGIVMKEFLS